MFGSRSRSRYQLVRQLEQADCGPAALLSVLRWHGGDVELAQLRQWCETDSRGTTLLDLQRAAQRCGFEAQGARGSYDDLSRAHLPCIAHLVEMDARHHYGVVYRVTPRRVVLGDPGRGVRRVPRRDFCRLWANGAVLLLTPTSNLLQRPALPWWRWIASYLFSQRAWIQQSLFLGLVITLLGLMTALFVQTLIDRHIPAGDPGHILYAGLIVLLLLLLRAGLGLVRAIFLVSLNQRITLAMTRDFIGRLFCLPRSFFDRRKTGDITARINDSLKIHQAVLLFSHSVILDSLIVLGSLSLMTTYSHHLALLCLAGLPLYAGLVAIGSRRVRDENRAVLAEHARVESAYIDRIRGIGDIRAFAVSRAVIRALVERVERFQQRLAELGRTQARLHGVSEAMAAVLTLALLTGGAAAVAAGDLQLGELVALYALLSYLLPAIADLVQAFVVLQGAQIAARRLLDILQVREEANPGCVHIDRLQCIQVQKLAFSYPKSPPLLRRVELVVERGYLTALWGATGSGKSTLVHLLQRQLEPQAGTLYCDDRPVQEIDLSSYRRQVAVVPQTIHLFNGTLLENVVLGRSGFDGERICALLDRLHLPDIARQLGGWSMLLGEEGRHLSGGETRLVGLVRALLDEPSLVILDEGFTGIDVETQSLLWQALCTYAQSHAVLLVTHDLGIVRACHRIYRLQEGKTVAIQSPAVAETGGAGDLEFTRRGV